MKPGRTPLLLAIGALVLSLFAGGLTPVYVLHSVPPNSDAAAGLTMLGELFAIGLGLVTIGLAIAAIVVRWRGAREVSWGAIAALVGGVSVLVLAPIVWLGAMVAAAPVGVH